MRIANSTAIPMNGASFIRVDAIHAIESGLSKVIIHATDTDVIVLALLSQVLWITANSGWLFVMVQNGVNSLSPYCISVRC